MVYSRFLKVTYGIPQNPNEPQVTTMSYSRKYFYIIRKAIKPLSPILWTSCDW